MNATEPMLEEEQTIQLIEHCLNVTSLFVIEHGYSQFNISFGRASISRFVVSADRRLTSTIMFGIPSIRRVYSDGFCEYVSVMNRIGPVIRSKYIEWPLSGNDGLTMLCMHEFSHALTNRQFGFDVVKPHQGEFSANLATLIDKYGGMVGQEIRDKLWKHKVRPFEIVQDAC